MINSITTSITLIKTNSKWIQRALSKFILTSVGLASHGQLLKVKHFLGPFVLEIND